MALKKCPECEKDVSSFAPKCPHCGYPISQTENTKKRKHGLPLGVKLCLVVLAVALVVFFLYLGNRLSPEEKSMVEDVSAKIEQIERIDKYSGDKIKAAEDAFSRLSKRCQRRVKNKSELEEARAQYDTIRSLEVSRSIDKIGTVTLDSENAIKIARALYDDLEDHQKSMVHNENVLISAEQALSDVQIQNCEKVIDEIGTPDINSQAKIKKAYDTYSLLSTEQKPLVSNLDVLQKADDTFNQLAIEHCKELIDEIGPVSLDSRQAIKDADDYFNSLSSTLKNKVENRKKLSNAKETFSALEKIEIEKAKTLSAGDVIKNQNWEVTYVRTRLTARLNPDVTSGAYLYYSCSDDNVYVDIVFKVKNISTDYCYLENVVTDGTLTYSNSYTYALSNLFFSKGDDIDPVYSWDSVSPLDSVTFHATFQIPRSAQSTSMPLKAELTVAGQQKIINVR